MQNSWRYILLRLLPKNFISVLVGKLVELRLPKMFSQWVIKGFVKHFRINVEEAEFSLEQYPSLQEFFVRKLKPGARKIDEDARIVSPCDGNLSEMGEIKDGKLIQAKGKKYSLNEFLGDEELAKKFSKGSFATIYLSPRDYHRFHSSISGQIIRTDYIPGHLWPVNSWAVTNIDQLFCVNERVVTLMREKESNKLVAQVAVGATMVGKICLNYFSVPHHQKTRETFLHSDEVPLYVKAGDELGQFRFGSTIVLLFEEGAIGGFLREEKGIVNLGNALCRKN